MYVSYEEIKKQKLKMGAKSERKDMNYNVFISTVKTSIEERLNEEISVRVCSARKNNGVEKIGLAFQKSVERLSPTIYMEEYYKQFEEGEAIEHIVDKVLLLYSEIRYPEGVDIQKLDSYDEIEDIIAYKLINYEKNKKLLEEIPHQKYLDFAIVYYLLLEAGEVGSATMLIRNAHLEMWNVSKEKIFEQAAHNTPLLLEPECCDIETVLEEFGLKGEKSSNPKLYVLTNQSRSFGAAAILYDGLLKKVEEMLGESYYILPSSVHEVIILPFSMSSERKDLELMVREINEEHVEEEEILSNRIFFYDTKKEPSLKMV